MQIFEGINEFTQINPRPNVFVFGMFDGFHRGHRELIKKAQNIAQCNNANLYILTFIIPPKRLFNNEQDVLTTNEEKAKIFKILNVDGIIFLNFNRDIAKIPAHTFMADDVAPKLNPSHIVVGEDFRFGSNQKGKEAMVNFCKVNIIPSVRDENGYKISSTKIREYVLLGKIEEANKLLGYNYFVDGVVIHGEGLASRYAVPTANISFPKFKLLPKGVFLGKTIVNGRVYPSAISVGFKSSIRDANPLSCETHILDFNEDIYNKKISIEFLSKLRDQEYYHSLDALFGQIKKDINKVRLLIKKQSR